MILQYVLQAGHFCEMSRNVTLELLMFALEWDLCTVVGGVHYTNGGV